MGGRRTEWKNQICFLVLSVSCFEVFRIPKASDTPLFECKNKWFTATSAAVSGRDCLSSCLPREGQWQMGCVQDFPVLPVLELGSPRACSVSPWPPHWRRWCELEKPSHQEVCKGSFSVTDHVFIHPSRPFLCLLVSLTSPPPPGLLGETYPDRWDGSDLSVLSQSLTLFCTPLVTLCNLVWGFWCDY